MYSTRTASGSSARRWPRARARPTAAGWAELLEHLIAGGDLNAFLAPAGDDDRRAVLADWRRRLVDRRLAPSTVNLALAAATLLLDSRAVRAPAVRRVEVDPKEARALLREQLRALQRETDRLACSRSPDPTGQPHGLTLDDTGAVP